MMKKKKGGEPLETASLRRFKKRDFVRMENRGDVRYVARRPDDEMEVGKKAAESKP